MSNKDRIWNEDDERAAREDGWLMAVTVDSGRPGSYYGIYPHGPRLPDPYAAMRWVIDRAKAGSKLHVRALMVIRETRMTK